MSQETVDRLKALLFEKETRDLGQLARELDEEKARARMERDTLANRLVEVEVRAGSDAHLTESVARVVDKAIWHAEANLQKTVPLGEALSPMVVRTIKTELASKHTENQIAGMLYPRIGDMITKYVSFRIQELMDRINRSLEQNAFLLRLRSIVTGKSRAELALADSERLEIEEIYLIRRGSGELVHHWSRDTTPGMPPGGDNRDAVVSGMLTALSSFVEEAFEADKSRLRALDLDSGDLDPRRIYLAGSPSLLVAFKTKGNASSAIEGLLDAEALGLLVAHQEVEERRLRAPASDRDAADASAEREHQDLLGEISQRLPNRISEREAEIRRARAFRQLRGLAWAIAIPLVAALAWQGWISWKTHELQARVDQTLTRTPELKGLITARVERGASAIWLAGVVPDLAARDVVVKNLREVAPGVAINDGVGTLPREDVGGVVRTALTRNALERAGLKLGQATEDLGSAAAGVGAPEPRDQLARAREVAGSVASRLRAPLPQDDGATRRDLDEALVALGAARDTLVALLAASAALPDAVTPGRSADAGTFAPGDGAASSAERVSLAAEQVSRLAGVLRSIGAVEAERTRLAGELERTRAAAAAERARLASEIAGLAKRVDALVPVPATDRQRLEELVRRNAVFFASGTDYRDAAAASAFLDEVARLVRATDVVVRVVGYTDETGGQQRNSPLSQSRADRVLADLVQRGAPRERLVAVGRATAIDISPRTGADSANRRVELEIGFIGERTAP